MSFPKLIPFIVALLIGGAIGYFIGHGNGKRSAQPAPTVTPADPASPAETVSGTAVAVKETSAQPEEPETGEPAPEKPAATTTLSASTTASAVVETLPTDNVCFSDINDLSLQLSLFAEGIEKDSVMYDNKNTANLADCSGMFLRVARFVKSKCDRYEYPEPTNARGTRELVNWYHQKNNLILVKNGKEDALAKRNLIKPGAVMFFGRSGQVYNDVNIDVARQNVYHVGTVTEVKKDAEGNVIGYTMFHGRSAGKIAQRSFYHSIDPPRLGFPVLGNWNQQWLGVAYIMTPKVG